jgi:hypothetical protein
VNLPTLSTWQGQGEGQDIEGEGHTRQAVEEGGREGDDRLAGVEWRRQARIPVRLFQADTASGVSAASKQCACAADWCCT